MACHTFASWTERTTPDRERYYSFCACRCFRKELRRVILALAARTASLLDSTFGIDTFGTSKSSEPGMAGSTAASIVELWLTGCMLMGPGWRDFLFCMRITRRRQIRFYLIGAPSRLDVASLC
jgi:hypothetical protein